MSLISLLVALLVICVLYWAATRLLGAFAVSDPIRTVVLVLFVVIVVLWLVSVLAPGAIPRLQ